MTSNTTPAIDRIPLAHSVRYVARGLPEVPNQYGPGVLAPSEITLTYRSASDSGLGRVHAYVAGRIWVDGVELPLLSGGLYGQHYDEGLSNWPEWLAEEARLHDPAAVPSVSAVDQTTRDRIRRVLAQVDGFDFDSLEPHDYQIQAAALLAVLPPPADRAAVLADAEGAIRTVTGNCGYKADDGCDFCNGVDAALEQLRRLAAEAQQPAVGARQPDTETPVVADDSDDSEHVDGCPGCTAFTLTGHITAAVPGRSAATSTDEETRS